MNIKLITAVSLNGVIGKDGTMPWSLKDDLKFFKEITQNHIVVMGRKTFESLNFKTLPNRHNIILTNSPVSQCIGKDSKIEKVVYQNEFTEVVYFDSKDKKHHIYFCNSVDKINFYNLYKIFFIPENSSIFVIGGSQVYNLFLNKCSKIYRSLILDNIDGDTVFPEIDEKKWLIENIQSFEANERNSNRFVIQQLSRIT